ncbi:GvpL/GvpF family gas vesicle protein [Streptomyces sp. NPDC059017]|uniref:GvpL/GvpF family gas vesicle protein n=1 Tax=Streptomyces sp. NPDC059017 TaxID=3346700 RepID=UPI0036BAE6DE
MSDRVSYVYAVLREAPGLREAVAELVGVAEGPVRLLPLTGGARLLIAVSPVPSEDFQEEALKRHLEDLRWLESVARAHHAVIEQLSARTTVLPLRLATVYLDDERARSALDAQRESLAERLSHLAAHVEWGVKIYVEPSASSASEPAEPTVSEELSPGRAYLRTRKAQRTVRDTAHRAARTAAERIEETGRRHAAGRARHRVQQGELAAAPGENVLNDAYLVPRDRAEEFRDEVGRAAEGLDGVRVELTGPWAPYSFATPPDTPEPEEAEPEEAAQAPRGGDTAGGESGDAAGPRGNAGRASGEPGESTAHSRAPAGYERGAET